MAIIKTSYPAADTTALTITLASLASDTGLLIGRASSVVDNTTNLDLDHILTGVITCGTTPTAGVIEVWVWQARKVVSGTPTYPDSITGTDAAKTMTSLNVKYSGLVLAASIINDTTTDRAYVMAGVSIASLFGAMPKRWGIFVVHSTVAALNATGGNHEFHYERIQGQTV